MRISGALRKTCVRAGAVLVAVMLGGCGTFYVDASLKEVTPAEKVAVANPQPAQLLFEFQTKGIRNGQATDLLKEKVGKIARESGLFSNLTAEPAPNGALVSITLNNVPVSDNAFAKGFVTGLTFGIVGNTVGDGYICTVDYTPGPGAPKITKMTRDAIYLSLGASSGPQQKVIKMKSGDEAIDLMTRKVVGNALNDLAKDPAFAKGTP